MLLCVAPSNKFILSSAWSMWNVYYLKTTTVSLSMSMSIALTGPLPLFVVFFCRLVKRLIASTSSIVQYGSEHDFRIWWLLKIAEQLSETVAQWDSWIFAVFFLFSPNVLNVRCVHKFGDGKWRKNIQNEKNKYKETAKQRPFAYFVLDVC